MSTNTLAVDSPGRSTLEVLLEQLALISRQLGCDSILESREGLVLAHAFTSHPAPTFADAVLHGSMDAIHGAVTRRRTLALLPSGPIQGLELGSAEALAVPLRSGGEAIGWWWLTGTAVPKLDDVRLTAAALTLEAALTDVINPALDPVGAQVLLGRGVLPPELSGMPLHVGRIRTGPAVGALHALRRAATERPVPGLAWKVWGAVDGCHLLIGGSSPQVVTAVDAWTAQMQELLRVEASAAVVGPCSHVEQVPKLVEQADLVLAAAGRSGRCVPLDQARQVLVADHLAHAVRTLPQIGEDPLAGLLAHDECKSADLATSLLAWLDGHGDTALVAQHLGVHSNTLRYRLQRVRELFGVDVSDPAIRLEAHLRLRHRASQR